MVDRDTVDYRDTSSFDDSSLQDVQTIKSAILHKQYGKDVRSALAQLPDALIKLFGDTGGNQEQLDQARTNIDGKEWSKLSDRLDAIERALKIIGMPIDGSDY